MKPITIDLTGLRQQFGLAADTIELLTETCVNAVTAAIYANWEALAKQELHSTLPEYLRNLIRVDKGRFEKQIVLTGVLPNMLEQGASPFDMKEGFKNSPKVKHTIPVYNKKGNQIYKGGDWYLTIPFRIGTPGALGQAGFAGVMPSAVYNLMRKRATGSPLTAAELPERYGAPGVRPAIEATPTTKYYEEYQHKNSIYEGLTKRTAQYGKTSQNTYGTFRRVSGNSDPLSWINKGLKALRLADKAVEQTDVDTIVENEVMDYLETIL